MSEKHSTDSIEYRPLPGFPGYRVGNDGSIWSCRSKNGKTTSAPWHPLRAHKPSNGYLSLTLCRDHKKYQRYVHRLILIAFDGPAPDGYQARHLDGCRDNNRKANLRWGTVAENLMDKRRHGKLLQGDQATNVKLSTDQVRAIRQKASCGMYHRAIAKEYRVTRQAIGAIVTRRNWRHI